MTRVIDSNALPEADHQTIKVLDYDVAALDLNRAVGWCLAAVREEQPKLLVTTNPEIIIQAETDSELKTALLAADLTVADGVGVVWAARQAGHALPGRVPGVELAARVLVEGGANLSVYFLGAKPGVAERAANNARERYGVKVAGYQHGYFKRPDDIPAVLKSVRGSDADLLLAGLGEGQELFLHRYRNELNIPLMIGVGGTLDVLAGEVTRVPPVFRRAGLEWLYRVGSDPKRWHRFPRLIRFVRLVLTRTSPGG